MSNTDPSEWWTVLTNGEWFIGKRIGRTLRSLHKLIMPTPEKPQCLIFPWLGVDSLEIPEGALWIACQAIPNIPWAKLLRGSEDLKLRLRAKSAGLHLAPAIPEDDDPS